MTIVTRIDMGRPITDAEKATRDAHLETLTAVTNGQNASTPDSTAGIRAWTTTEAASDYIAWCNANYAPPPVSAEIQTI